MSKPGLLVLDGNAVKLRILAERHHSGSMVHVDWVRFTCPLRLAPVPEVDVLFPRWDSIDHDNQRHRAALSMRDLEESEHLAVSSAWELASQVAQCLGSDLQVEADYRKGMDFYKYRWPLSLNGSEVGWVGFLAASESPRQKKQAESVHVNIHGAACTFAATGWRDRLADLMDSVGGVLTRVDLALDFFDGYPGGVEKVVTDYIGGACNVGGRKLKYSQVGDWANGHDRSVYVGSRETGKVTNVYEKGDQLYGEKAGSPWIRFELRYGNKVRVLTSDMLRRPDDFFAGASDWHASVMLEAGRCPVAEWIPRNARLQIDTVVAEVSRNVRWLFDTAGPSMALALQTLDFDKLWPLIEHSKLPGRLRKFSLSQIAKAYGVGCDIGSTVGALSGHRLAV